MLRYCINSDCPKPQNPETNKFCQGCGWDLLLQERYRAISLISESGFSRTFLAVDEEQSPSPCVVKQLFFFQAEDGIRDIGVTGVQTCALPIYLRVDPCRRTRTGRAGSGRCRTPACPSPGSRAGGSPLPGTPRSRRTRTAGRRRSSARSEERRVGKECRSRWSPYH